MIWCSDVILGLIYRCFGDAKKVDTSMSKKWVASMESSIRTMEREATIAPAVTNF